MNYTTRGLPDRSDRWAPFWAMVSKGDTVTVHGGERSDHTAEMTEEFKEYVVSGDGDSLTLEPR